MSMLKILMAGHHSIALLRVIIWRWFVFWWNMEPACLQPHSPTTRLLQKNVNAMKMAMMVARNIYTVCSINLFFFLFILLFYAFVVFFLFAIAFLKITYISFFFNTYVLDFFLSDRGLGPNAMKSSKRAFTRCKKNENVSESFLAHF